MSSLVGGPSMVGDLGPGAPCPPKSGPGWSEARHVGIEPKLTCPYMTRSYVTSIPTVSYLLLLLLRGMAPWL